MKVILVNGSPHKNGCTHRALAEVATTLDAHGIESEIFWIGAKPAAGCMACGRCRETGACIFDDAVNEFRARAEQADGFVFGAPVHYAHAASSLMGFMDRLFYSNGKAGARRTELQARRGHRVRPPRRHHSRLDDMQKFLHLEHAHCELPLLEHGPWMHARKVEQDGRGCGR
ncbi:MAG: flavodoxin family protein [Collinsella intestinalis]